MGYSKYIAGNVIGVGSYAKVKIGYAVKFKKSVALKIIDQNKAPVSFLKKFLPRELNVLSKVHHANIIEFYECFSHGAKIIMVMELAKYGDLLELVKAEGKIAENKANILFKQIADGVEYLHFNQIVHRDLKCENILLAEGLTVKIGDFGFSRFFDEEEVLKTACGSLAYSSPELLRGFGYTGPPCDIWSMGVILFTTVCGVMPFKELNLKSLVARQESKTWTFPQSLVRPLSHYVKELIEGMLETDTEARLTIQEVHDSDWLVSLKSKQDNAVLILPPIKDTLTAKASETNSQRCNSQNSNKSTRSATANEPPPSGWKEEATTPIPEDGFKKQVMSPPGVYGSKEDGMEVNTNAENNYAWNRYRNPRHEQSLVSPCTQNYQTSLTNVVKPENQYSSTDLPPPPPELLNDLRSPVKGKKSHTRMTSQRHSVSNGSRSGFSTPPLLRTLAYGGKEAFDLELIRKKIHPP